MHHCALSDDLLDDPASLADEMRALFQTHHPGNACGSDFSEAMTDDGVRDDSPGFPQLVQRDLNREQRRLRNLRAGKTGSIIGSPELFEQRAAKVSLHMLRTKR